MAGRKPSRVSQQFIRKQLGDWGPLFRAAMNSTCPQCGATISKGHPAYMWNGGEKPVAVHHACARFLPDPPPMTTCSWPDCTNATGCFSAAKGVGFVITDLCFRHRNRDATTRGVTKAEVIKAKYEELQAIEAEEEEWLRSKGLLDSP